MAVAVRRYLQAARSAPTAAAFADMAAEGAGVAMLPKFHVAEHLRTRKLLHVLPDWSPPDLWLTLYYPPYQALPPRISSFSKFFEQQVPAFMSAME